MLSTLVKKTAVPVMLIALVSTASVGLADTAAQKQKQKRAKTETTYYQDRAQNSANLPDWRGYNEP
jgi:hypothetical protein